MGYAIGTSRERESVGFRGGREDDTDWANKWIKKRERNGLNWFRTERVLVSYKMKILRKINFLVFNFCNFKIFNYAFYGNSRNFTQKSA